jgi:predicted ester cyclase
MSIAQNKETVRCFLEQALGTSNLDLADELFAPNYTNHGMTSLDQPTDREAAKQLARQMFSAFPDLRVTIRDLAAEGDIVMARYAASGTH